MGEHDALGRARGAGGVDEGREIVRLDGGGDGVKLRVGALLAGRAGTTAHVDGVAQLGSLVHHDDVLEAGLLANGSQLLVLLRGWKRRRYAPRNSAARTGPARRSAWRRWARPRRPAAGLRSRRSAHSARFSLRMTTRSPFADAPGLQLAGCGIDPASQLSGRDRLPRLAFAGEHDAGRCCGPRP